MKIIITLTTGTIIIGDLGSKEEIIIQIHFCYKNNVYNTIDVNLIEISCECQK